MRLTSLRKFGRRVHSAVVGTPLPSAPPSYGIQSHACTGHAQVFDRTGEYPAFARPQVCQLERLRTLCGHPLNYRLTLPDGTQATAPAALVHILPEEPASTNLIVLDIPRRVPLVEVHQ
ncbi:hypothetical protein NKW54_04520 [Acetobacter cerevisiae]|uniref:Uncharacterized protein n=1 Tax=Acetobacter cerevisiae TaxID=178900 RepID=A0ABT1EP99_9PROT|nr:hypothetical protein [Acetobacter cerevisiae]MCP1245201.1 hypothetical protein [Acetobacter cerevisiae]MCP1254572.1 hypothetical protein [Acetobacter cerevisiae]